MSAPAWTLRLRERVVDLSVQAILIVFAVLLALGAEEWWDERELLATAAEVRLAVEAEIEGNLAELEAAEAGLTAGRAVVDQLVGILRQGQRDGVGLEALDESLDELDLPFPRISTAAWRVAQTSRAAPYLEYGWLIERATLYDSFERYARVWDWIVEDAANVTGIAEDDMDVALEKVRTLRGHLSVLAGIHIGLQERITEHLGQGAVPPTLAGIAADDSRVRRLTLRDGRRLVYAEYGDPAGVPLVELHGGGANHLSGVVYHREALAEGVRVISVSRPGVGGSTAHEGFSVASYHDDFVQLLDALELPRVVVMGNSNGGMFALALAHALPERIAGAMPLNPATPVFDDEEAWTLTPIYHALAESGPAAWVEGTRSLSASLATGSDEEIAAYRASDPYRQFPEDTETEVVRAYFAAAEFESDAFLREVGFVLDRAGWGFDIFDIAPRVEFFTGVTEVGTPYNRVWAEKLPNAGLHLTTGGHMGQTAPATRKLLMACVLALHRGEACAAGEAVDQD